MSVSTLFILRRGVVFLTYPPAFLATWRKFKFVSAHFELCRGALIYFYVNGYALYKRNLHVVFIIFMFNAIYLAINYWSWPRDM